jgi:hypothetical protein
MRIGQRVAVETPFAKYEATVIDTESKFVLISNEYANFAIRKDDGTVISVHPIWVTEVTK